MDQQFLDYPTTFPPPDVSTIPPPPPQDYDNYSPKYVAAAGALFLLVLFGIGLYMYFLRKKESNERQKDLEKGIAYEVELAKRTANHYERLRKTRYRDLESGFEYYDMKPKQVSFAKDARKSNVSEGQGKTNHDGRSEDAKIAKNNAQGETNHDGQSKDAKIANDNTKRNSLQGETRSDNRLVESKDELTRNGKSKKGKSAACNSEQK